MKIVSINKIVSNQATIELDDNSIINNVNIIYPFGLFGNIEINEGSLGLLFSDGSLDHCYVMPFNISIQPQLSSGQVRVGNKTSYITFENGKATFSGDLLVKGKLESEGETTLEGKKFLLHQHSGVQSGGSNSGGVV